MILLHVPDMPAIRYAEQVSLAMTPASTIPLTLKATTAAVTTFAYRVEYKLRNRKTDSTGEPHTTYIRDASEANVLAELNKQNLG